MLIAVLVLIALVVLGVVAYIGGEKNVNNASKSQVKRQEKDDLATKLAQTENLLENWAEDLMSAKKTPAKKSSAKKATKKAPAAKKVAKKAPAKKSVAKKVAKKAPAKKVAKKAGKKTSKR
jgi:hypothetical protein